MGAAAAGVQSKEALLLRLVCPPIQSELLSIAALLVPYSQSLKERSTTWVSTLLTKSSGIPHSSTVFFLKAFTNLEFPIWV